MKVVASDQTVASYCQALERGDVSVNRAYQRSDKVWPTSAQSFLVETVLLGYPMPKFTLYETTDLRTRRTVSEIVDGQQRSEALRRFFGNGLKLGRRSALPELEGLTFEDLPQEFKERFLQYRLSVEVLVATTREEIREVFRRINSYTVPLNHEELRHATWQGAFKWFIYELTSTFDEVLSRLGVFAAKQFVRMADAKLFCEIIHAVLYGVSTTNKTKLDRLYREFDSEFPMADRLQRRFASAFDAILELPEIHRGSLMKPHMFYSLMLAVMDAQEEVPSLAEQRGGSGAYSAARAVRDLSVLAEAFEAGDEAPSQFAEFVVAGSGKTNVSRERAIRVRWLRRAAAGELGTVR